MQKEWNVASLGGRLLGSRDIVRKEWREGTAGVDGCSFFGVVYAKKVRRTEPYAT